MLSSDRKEFERLRLGKPILGLLDDQNALILDIGVSGAYVEHYGKPAIGSRVTLLFRWKGADVGFHCNVVRTDVIRSAANDVVSHTDLQFAQPIGQSEARVNDMVATFVGKILAAQRANAAAGDASESGALIDLGGARRSRARNFITYRYQNGQWSRTFSDKPDQPADGFTVASYEDEDELRTLCQTYVTADAEGRRLIRLVADLSARTVKK